MRSTIVVRSSSSQFSSQPISWTTLPGPIPSFSARPCWPAALPAVALTGRSSYVWRRRGRRPVPVVHPDWPGSASTCLVCPSNNCASRLPRRAGQTAPMSVEGHAHEHPHGHDQGHGHAPAEGPARRLLDRVRHAVSPHSHDTATAVDRALEASGRGMRTLLLSLLVLAATAAIQAVVAALSGSVALLGDTLHNVADALTAVPLGLAFWLGRRPPTRRYTYGYGRAEDLAGVIIVVLIAASSALAAYEPVRHLRQHS